MKIIYAFVKSKILEYKVLNESIGTFFNYANKILIFEPTISRDIRVFSTEQH